MNPETSAVAGQPDPSCHSPVHHALESELERVKQQLESYKRADRIMDQKLSDTENALDKAKASEARLLAALKDAEAMLSAGNEQGIGVIRAAIAATEEGK